MKVFIEFLLLILAGTLAIYGIFSLLKTDNTIMEVAYIILGFINAHNFNKSVTRLYDDLANDE